MQFYRNYEPTEAEIHAFEGRIRCMKKRWEHSLKSFNTPKAREFRTAQLILMLETYLTHPWMIINNEQIRKEALNFFINERLKIMKDTGFDKENPAYFEGFQQRCEILEVLVSEMYKPKSKPRSEPRSEPEASEPKSKID